MENHMLDLPCGAELVEFDEIDSTNLEAMRRVGAGEAGPLWIMARRQPLVEAANVAAKSFF